MNHESRLAAALKRDRLIVLTGLAGVAALAWAYLLSMSRAMTGMATEWAMPWMEAEAGLEVPLTFAMWAVMMVAMMAPSVAPVVQMFVTIKGSRPGQQGVVWPTAVFLLGYLTIWMGFSALATLVQWALHTLAWRFPGVVGAGPILGGALLVVVGLYQWTPLKHACLSHCRSPLGFFMTDWREGTGGALVMGLKHGAYCLGCCWLLMSILLLTGVMNLLWMGLVTALILLEKVTPAGLWVARAAGLLLIGGGVWMAAAMLL